MSAAAPDFSAAFKAVGNVFGQLASAVVAAGREVAKVVDSQHGVPITVVCERGHKRTRISGDEAAVLGNPKLRRRGIACRTRGCDGRSHVLSDPWGSP